jgi:hypothetical protein
MWLVVVVCVAVIAGICLGINLFPKRFFEAPLASTKIVVMRSPVQTTPLPDAIANESAFLQQSHKYCEFRLRAALTRFETEARLATPRELKGAGLDPEKIKIVIELSAALVHETNSDDFAKTMERLLRALKGLVVRIAETTDGTYEVAHCLAVAGSLAPLIGPAFALMVAYTSLAMVKRQARESATLRRNLFTIANLIESGTISKFEIAYETIQGNFQRACPESLPLVVARTNMNNAMREWLHHFVARIENAPSPIEQGWFSVRRTTEFDGYIAGGFAPIARYFLIGIFTDFMIAEKLGGTHEFLTTLTNHVFYLKTAKEALRKRMVAAGIEHETTSVAASIAVWLNERCMYLDCLVEKLRSTPTFQVADTPTKLTFRRKVRYLVLRCAIVVRRIRQVRLQPLRARAKSWRHYGIAQARIRLKGSLKRRR